MKTRYGILAPFLLAAACSSAPAGAPAPAPAPAPTPAPVAAEPPAPPPPAEERLTEAPDAWQLLDLGEDRVPGASVARAYRELLAGRQPQREIVVAIIDSGVDTAQVDLRDVLWRNADETPGNGVDDDQNGYVDDVRGWNFIGGPDGRNVDQETFEETRLSAACQAGTAVPSDVDCQAVTQAFNTRRLEVVQTLTQIDQIEQALGVIVPLLRTQLGDEEMTVDNVEAIESDDPQINRAKTTYVQLERAGVGPDGVAEAKDAYQGMLDYGLNPEFNPRDIVGDDLADGTEVGYGNHDVTGPDARHGTHVAGIIGAARGNGLGIDGIAAGVRLMSVRAIPDGDERDKDVANAIRYAVDNGAQVVNMSFGKSFSPRKPLVDAAVKYAEERGVLLIHAAGNDGENNDDGGNYPTRRYDDGSRASNWIEVGASNWVVDSLAAPFSNYGKQDVDLFAPGMAILSTVPGDEFDRLDGTSMAAPVVTGVAALLMAYFPELGVADVKRILLASSVKYADRMVPQPGSGQPVSFGSLSVTGGVVNAYEAVRMALEGRPRS